MSENSVEQLSDSGESLSPEEIEISALEDSAVYLRFPMKKKLLAENSPVFEKQFCGRLRTITADGEFQYLDMEDFSPKACRAFLGYSNGDGLYFASHAKECELTLELYLIADKYQIAGLKTELEEAVVELKIKEAEVFIAMDAVLKFIEFAPVEELCRKILRKCAEVVHYNQTNVLKLWTKCGGENSKALMMLNEDFEKLTGGQETMQLKVSNITQFKDGEEKYSPAYIIQNLPWNLCIKKVDDFLAYYLNCNEEDKSTSWSCNAAVEFRILNHKDGKHFTDQFSEVFSYEYDWGETGLMKWSDLIDPNNGYIKDDTVIFEIEVKADIPQGIHWDSDELVEKKRCENCLLHPCMDGQTVKEAWEGLKVARKQESRLIVKGVRKSREGQFNFPVKNKDGSDYFLHLQQLSVKQLEESLVYSCENE